MLAARPVQGFFRSLRTRANWILIAILFVVPWVRIAGEPLILLDIPQRQFHVFGMVIFPQELFFLWLILVALALALFFFTALAGRVWCGWACPQTVFSDVYAGVARRIQGWTRAGAPRRVARWRSVATHAAWIAMSAVVALHVIGYFHSVYDFLGALATRHWAGASAAFWIAVTAVCYLDFGLVRQTWCKYLCPYARFQSVLLDPESLVVAYDAGRGEPRGKRAARHKGDCVDCGLCVAVCPTGIDIRKGLQLECISCTQCIDACNGVMARVGRVPNLIAYRSLAALEGRRTRLLRPRVVVYGVLLIASCIAFAATVAQRNPLSLEVERNRTALYQRMPDGRIGNSYTLHLQNRDRRQHVYRIRLEAPASAQLVAGVNPLLIPATGTVTASVFVIAEAGDVESGAPVRFVFEDLENLDRPIVRESTFVAPAHDEDEEEVHAG
ncbi:MAG: cytochrome c oxidase accessory protein CcoG [Proteobacteria bacterium]|nr:MAG: cytochrome c oxidase accessory protein CcoG [Pseudomonadota bacterium]